MTWQRAMHCHHFLVRSRWLRALTLEPDCLSYNPSSVIYQTGNIGQITHSVLPSIISQTSQHLCHRLINNLFTQTDQSHLSPTHLFLGAPLPLILLQATHFLEPLCSHRGTSRNLFPVFGNNFRIFLAEAAMKEYKGDFKKSFPCMTKFKTANVLSLWLIDSLEGNRILSWKSRSLRIFQALFHCLLRSSCC